MKKSSIDNWDSIEKKWQEKLASHEEEVPAAIWNQIEKKLDEKKGRAIPFIINRKQWSWAAILLISFGLGWWQLSNTDALLDHANIANQISTQAPKTGIESTLTEQAEVASLGTTSESYDLAPKVARVSHHSSEKESHDSPAPAASNVPVIIESNTPNNPVILADNRTFEKEKPASLVKEESVEMLIDIQPSQTTNTEKENSYVPEPSKKRNSLFARVVKQLKHAIDGDPVDWQTLKQGDPKLENSIHQVANTYIKTEQVVQRTFQF